MTTRRLLVALLLASIPLAACGATSRPSRAPATARPGAPTASTTLGAAEGTPRAGSAEPSSGAGTLPTPTGPPLVDLVPDVVAGVRLEALTETGEEFLDHEDDVGSAAFRQMLTRLGAGPSAVTAVLAADPSAAEGERLDLSVFAIRVRGATTTGGLLAEFVAYDERRSPAETLELGSTTIAGKVLTTARDAASGPRPATTTHGETSRSSSRARTRLRSRTRSASFPSELRRPRGPDRRPTRGRRPSRPGAFLPRTSH